MKQTPTLDSRQLAMVPVAALAATGNLQALKPALNHGLDAGLTISDAREVLVQLYAYAGFPRSLNALGTLMTVLDERRGKGIEDSPGQAPSQPIPKGDALLALGTTTQTTLAGAPVRGPLFEFAPAIDEYLKSHLFGDIFARDNLSWADREVATLAMLSAMQGVEAQLRAHVGISMNVGLSREQIEQIAERLAGQVSAESAERIRAALAQSS